jgi:hypothetical protein
MARISPPMRLWPLGRHIAAATLMVGATLASAQWVLHFSQQRLVEADTQLRRAREQLRGEQERLRAHPAAADVIQRFPFSSQAEEVIRQATRYAEAHGVQITSLSVERRPAPPGDLGQSRFSLTMAGSYVPFKAWLADMLDRNTTLALESLVLRRDDKQLGVQLTLVLFTQD